jgi:hypothetical protein
VLATLDPAADEITNCWTVLRFTMRRDCPQASSRAATDDSDIDPLLAIRVLAELLLPAVQKRCCSGRQRAPIAARALIGIMWVIFVKGLMGFSV